MHPRNRRGRRAASGRGRFAVALAGAGVTLLLVAVALPANALTVFDPPDPVTGNATWFYGLGGPYGGCGMTQTDLETQDFVALNVYDLPGDYSTFYNRPMDPSLADRMGMWNNGHNCGRWVSVTVGDYCTGVNDGAPNLPFCRDGSWVSDAYSGATLKMIVADSCVDGNAWCRDDPYHLDLARASLNRFVKNGTAVGDMDPDHWNNRKLTWEFVPAPEYTGDIQLGFLQSAQPYWPAIAVSRLANGIHGVEYYQGGAWKSAVMNGDMGQSYIIGGTVEGGTQFQIRVRDVDDQLINNGRVYRFAFPASCATICNGAYTKASYTTATAPVDPTADPTGTGTCTASYLATGSWPGGFMAQVTVRSGDTAISGWSVSWTPGGDQTIGDVWNGTKSVSGTTVTVSAAGWNQALAADTPTTFGFTATGTESTPTMTCTAF
jgi:hypothetical protein